MFKNRNARADGGTCQKDPRTKGTIRGTTAPGTRRGGGIRPEEPGFFANSGHIEGSPRDNRGAMRPRLLFAAPVLLAVWIASSRGGPGVAAGDAASAKTRYDPSETPTSQPDRLGSSSAAVGAGQSEPTRTPTAPPEIQAAVDPAFAATVRPILVSHCAPCHEPGGKMYDRLPFDRGETIASHREGVLRRIQKPEEKAAIQKWLASQPAS